MLPFSSTTFTFFSMGISPFRHKKENKAVKPFFIMGAKSPSAFLPSVFYNGCRPLGIFIISCKKQDCQGSDRIFNIKQKRTWIPCVFSRKNRRRYRFRDEKRGFSTFFYFYFKKILTKVLYLCIIQDTEFF